MWRPLNGYTDVSLSLTIRASGGRLINRHNLERSCDGRLMIATASLVEEVTRTRSSREVTLFVSEHDVTRQKSGD